MKPIFVLLFFVFSNLIISQEKNCFDLARMYPNLAPGMTDWIKKQRKLAKRKNRSNKV